MLGGSGVGLDRGEERQPTAALPRRSPRTSSAGALASFADRGVGWAHLSVQADTFQAMTESRWIVQTANESRSLIEALRRAGMSVQGDGQDGASLAGRIVETWGEGLDDAGVEELAARVAPRAVRG